MAKEVVGWIEKVRIFPGDLTVKAKIDTGAQTSSIHCDCINFIHKKSGEDWVRFSITGEKGKTQWLERKVIRTATIKRHFGKAQERSVVKLGLGNVYKEAEVTLVDRSGLNYQLLVGREFLKEIYLVDPGDKFLVKPDCKGDFSIE